jgi:hypothetical protein
MHKLAIKRPFSFLQDAKQLWRLVGSEKTQLLKFSAALLASSSVTLAFPLALVASN